MNAVTSGAFVEKIQKAVDALENLDDKEKKIEEEKQKVESLRAKNEAKAKSLAGFDRKSFLKTLKSIFFDKNHRKI